MKKKICKVLTAVLLLTLVFGMTAVTSSAYEAYETYTYDIDGEIVPSPAAYSAGISYDSYSMGLMTDALGNRALTNGVDIFADADGYVYLVDKGSTSDTSDLGRVVILDSSYHVYATVSSYTDEYGRAQTLNHPTGVYVTNPDIGAAAGERGTKEMYICDHDNRRVVVFVYNKTTAQYEYARTIGCPTTPLLSENDFYPSSIAVDKYGRIFLITEKVGGVLMLSSDGEFTGFIGAQKVSGTVWDRIWHRFESAEDRQNSVKAQSVSYNNITVDDDGFIYVTSTTDTSNAETRLGNMKKKSADNSPVKKLNPAGAEIMDRNGFFDPSGEVTNFQNNLSNIVDIAIGPEGTWSILDKKHARIFTYSANGELLFAFGDSGDQLGNGESVIGITYQKTYDENGKEMYVILMLDGSSKTVKLIPYTPTVYCDSVMEALAAENRNEYDNAEQYWQNVLTKNNNFDLAYIGIGKALYSQEHYTEAMEMLEKAYETQYYAKAFQARLSDTAGKFLLLIVIGIVGICVLLAKFFGFAKKKNKATSLKVGRKTYGEELLYVFHLIFHPFDGFWDLKHEQRGSVRAAWTLLGITALSLFYNSIGKAYIFNPKGEFTVITAAAVGLLILVMLWVCGNWGLTSLFDGEGSFRDVFVATCYAVAPMSFFYILSTLLTNFMTDSGVINLLLGIGYVWVGFLLFFGMLTTHDYSLGKNLLITICTIVAMVVIMFVALLFTSLLAKMVSFLVSLFTEIGDRI